MLGRIHWLQLKLRTEKSPFGIYFRYACNVCSHVSRSKDALRKHVSYRHPGAPSPCESETRRKRSKTLAAPFHLMKPEPTELQSTASPQTPSNQPFMFLQNQFHPPNGSPQSTSAPTTPGTPTPSEITNTKKESTNSEITDSVWLSCCYEYSSEIYTRIFIMFNLYDHHP